MAENSKKYDKQRSQFLLTLNNPLEYGYSHEKIHELIRIKFRHVQFYCMADDLAPTTGTPHTHLYILLTPGSKKRQSAVMNIFEKAHVEPEVKGSPAQIVDYIKKEAKNLSEDKKNSLVENSYEEWGSIPVVMPSDNRNDILLQIQEYIDKDYSPREIMNLSILYVPFETIIRKRFYAKRYQETPILRELTCYYHVGSSGSGKSFTFVKLCEQYGSDEVFIATDYANKCASLFDGYEAERIVVLDELKINVIPYEFMLQILQGYRTQIHCRYNNVYALYTEIHITSIYTPHEIYNGMVSVENRESDSIQQLLRRIHYIVYHYKNDDGTYGTYQIPMSEYTTYEELQQRAEAEKNGGFIPLDGDSPFDEPEQGGVELPDE